MNLNIVPVYYLLESGKQLKKKMKKKVIQDILMKTK